MGEKGEPVIKVDLVRMSLPSPVLRRRVSVFVGGETQVKQSFKDQCDINRIIEKYRATGLIDHVRGNPGVYEDVSNVPDYQEALHRVDLAQEAFSGLPSSLRSRFENDPGQFVAWLRDKANMDEAVKLGLLVKREGTAKGGVPVPAVELPKGPDAAV